MFMARWMERIFSDRLRQVRVALADLTSFERGTDSMQSRRHGVNNNDNGKIVVLSSKTAYPLRSSLVHN